MFFREIWSGFFESQENLFRICALLCFLKLWRFRAYVAGADTLSRRACYLYTASETGAMDAVVAIMFPEKKAFIMAVHSATVGRVSASTIRFRMKFWDSFCSWYDYASWKNAVAASRPDVFYVNIMKLYRSTVWFERKFLLFAGNIMFHGCWCY